MSDAKQQVLAATDLVQLISRTVQLRRNGKTHIGCCPFHQEKTPSFYVYPDQHYYCFGCKKHGNAIDFVIERDRIEFIDALKLLAEEANIELPKFGGGSAQTSQRAQLLDAQNAAAKVFRRLLLLDSRGKKARDYLRERGFTEATLDEFRVGYAADAWDVLRDSPEMKPFEASLLQQAGLLKSREQGGGFYDTFRDRVMFPIRDESGKTIAFGGRVLPGGDSPAKYLNSPETPLFSKSKTAYGLDVARQRIVETRTAVIVEGYTDVLMAHQYDVKNVVSVLGTALTEQHVNLLKRFADRIVLLFDADAAGAGAADRSLELFLTQPIEIAIATLPEGKDPDEVLLESGKPGFEHVVSTAVSALDFIFKTTEAIIRDPGTPALERTSAIESFLDRLTKISLSVEQRSPALAKGMKLKLGASLAALSHKHGLDLALLQSQRRDRARLAQRNADRSPTQSVQVRVLTARERSERDLIGAILLAPTLWQDAQKRVKYIDFATPTLRRLAEAMWDCYRNEGAIPFNEFADLMPPDLRSAAAEAAHEALDRGDPARLIDASLAFLDEEKARDAQRQDVAAASASTDDDELTALLRRVEEQAKRPDLRRF